MGIGASEKQGKFEDAARVLGDRLERGSVYRLLADDGHRLFPDDYFADLFMNSRRGRPTVPARVVATVMLLRSFEGLSDREALDRLSFDLRWQAACGLTVAAEGFHPTVLVGMRNRLRASGRPRRLLEDTVALAKAAGLVRGRVRALDSTPLYDSVATQDTITQLRGAIRALLRAAPSGLAGDIRAVLCRDDDYAQLGKPVCDWDDPGARDELVDALVRDCLRALEVVEKASDLDVLTREAAELVALVAGQDVESGDDGRWRIVRGVAKDRVLSIVDTDARHGHKSRNRRFDGYKAHVAVDPGSEIITEVTATAANVPDREAIDDLIGDLTDNAGIFGSDVGEMPSGTTSTEGSAGETPVPAEPSCSEENDPTDTAEGPRIVGDSAYADGATRVRLAEAGIDVMAKVPPARNSRGGFTKDRFTIELDAGRVTCPAQITVPIRYGRSAKARAHFGAHCAGCPLRPSCTSARRGRQVTIHPHEAELQRARAAQRDPDWIATYRATRPIVERKISHFARRLWGGRKARCRSLTKITTDVLTRAAAINLARIATLQHSPPAGLQPT